MIDWVSGAPPIDEPLCGYRGELCIPPKTYTLEIIGGVIGGLALVLVVVALFVYRYVIQNLTYHLLLEIFTCSCAAPVK